MDLVIDFSPNGRPGVGMLTARMGGEVLAAEKVDLLRPKQRTDFAVRLCASRPGLESAAVEAELLRLAGEIAERPLPAPDTAELDVSAIARPELFHTAAVSGVLIPVAHRSAGEARGRWALYLRWANGRREKRELESSLDLPGGSRLWVHPVPSPPEPTARAAWSASARRAWLGGEPAPDPCEVWQRIAERLARYLDFPPDSASATVATLALWVMFSYTFPAWASVPYLSIGGPLASGKSTLFRVLARLVFRPIESSNVTAPCLFRTLHERGGVLLLDEAERLREGTPDAGELRSILLSGYKRGSPAMRLEKQGETFRRVEFDCFGPKALACIGSLPESLASRCIRVGMFRSAPDSDKPRRRLDADPATWQSIRDDLHSLTLEHGPTWLALADRPDVVPTTFGGRDYELWQPLLSLAAWLEEQGAGGLLRIVQEHGERSTEAARDDSTPDADETLLRLLGEAVADGRHYRLKPSELLKLAQERDEGLFRSWSWRGVANALKRYGLQSVKRGGERVYASVTREALARVERSYGIDLKMGGFQSSPSAPSAPSDHDPPG